MLQTKNAADDLYDAMHCVRSVSLDVLACWTCLFPTFMPLWAYVVHALVCHFHAFSSRCLLLF